MINLSEPPEDLGGLRERIYAGDIVRIDATPDSRGLVDDIWREIVRELGDDPRGAQIGGAVKNVIAIACGIARGRGMGDNAGAALITRGLAEMARLGAALGARRETLMGLSGLGDLVLSCTHEQSRNFSLGMAIGAGDTLDDYLAARSTVAEGVASAQATVLLASRHGVHMPIAAAVDAVLNRAADIDAEIAGLLARPFTPGLG